MTRPVYSATGWFIRRLSAASIIYHITNTHKYNHLNGHFLVYLSTDGPQRPLSKFTAQPTVWRLPNKYGDLLSPRSKAQALGWCSMCSIFSQTVCRYVALLVSVITTLLCCEEYFSLSSVVLRSFSALCIYSKFRHRSYPIGYLCTKFSFFCGLDCWASPWRKIVYSLAQSLIQLIWCPGNRSLCFGTTFSYHHHTQNADSCQQTF